jgi:putative oxidoreductase
MTSLRQLLVGTGTASAAADAALCVLRVFAGVAFIMHGWGKVIDVNGFAEAHHVPLVLGAAAAYVQFIGAMLLLVGLFVPLAALGIGGTMVVAVATLIRDGEPFVNPGGHSWESAALYAVLMASFVVIGAGRYSLDHIIFVRGGTVAHFGGYQNPK